MKKLIFLILWNLFLIKNTFWEDIKNSIIPDSWNNVVVNQKSWDDLLFSVIEYVRESIFWLLALIAITVFIFIWARLVIARWNQEEFKKAIMHFVYAVVWIALVALSWAAVKLVSSLNF